MFRFIFICFIACFWTILAQADGFDGTREIHFSFLGKDYSIKTRELPDEFQNSHNNENSF